MTDDSEHCRQPDGAHSAHQHATYQVDGVKHLDFSYRSAARVGQVTVVIADGQGAQTFKHQ